MTVCTGRARGVIQEVATDKIHQIAGEEQGGGREGGHFRVHKSFTRVLSSRAGLLQASTHNESPNHLL